MNQGMSKKQYKQWKRARKSMCLDKSRAEKKAREKHERTGQPYPPMYNLMYFYPHRGFNRWWKDLSLRLPFWIPFGYDIGEPTDLSGQHISTPSKNNGCLWRMIAAGFIVGFMLYWVLF